MRTPLKAPVCKLLCDALANTLGLAILTGGSARLRIYGRAGLSPAEIGRVVALTSLTFWLGVLAVFGVAMLVEPGALRLPGLAASASFQTMVGVAALAAVAAWLALCARGRPLRCVLT